MVTLEKYQWKGEGYKPLLFSDGWQVAILNWEPVSDRENLSEIERHNQTDEVFVLLQGCAVLFTKRDFDALEANELEPGVVYNVPKGVWHNLVATHDVVFLIVENRDTHLYDTEIRSMTPEEEELLDLHLSRLSFIG